MNVHHLELFYYVARHGGISRALQYMPYGIQQPAVSGQWSETICSAIWLGGR